MVISFIKEMVVVPESFFEHFHAFWFPHSDLHDIKEFMPFYLAVLICIHIPKKIVKIGLAQYISHGFFDFFVCQSSISIQVQLSKSFLETIGQKYWKIYKSETWGSFIW